MPLLPHFKMPWQEDLSHDPARQGGFYKAILGNPGGLGGVGMEAIAPIQAFLQDPGFRSGVGAAAALPVPWGSRMHGEVRTAPALPMQQRMRQQAVKDMWRDATKSIEGAPQLSPGSAWAQEAMNELAMRDIGMSKQALYKRHLDNEIARKAQMDQMVESYNGLQSLLPDPAVVPLMNEKTQSLVRTLLNDAKENVNQRMRWQAQGGELPQNFPTAPEVIENHRNMIARVLEQHSNVQGGTAGQKLYAAVTKLRRNEPGADLNKRHYGMH